MTRFSYQKWNVRSHIFSHILTSTMLFYSFIIRIYLLTLGIKLLIALATTCTKKGNAMLSFISKEKRYISLHSIV